MNMPASEGARFQFASDQSVLVYFDSSNQKGRSEDRPLHNHNASE
jgi:hypothetical protein